MKLGLDVDVHVQNTDSTKSINDDLTLKKKDTDRFNGINNERKNSITFSMKRKDAEKLVKYVSEHVELEGDIINPKPVDVKLVTFGSLKSDTK
ncbi:unnamed protein product [Didymodactylos carnosus]|uniref:Uncharacterized protein n=1 Tax=Didymodactylos carnosus TaxID=1234261 RepID=A0A814JHV0_9BILA|nr:unnamed protein product [Didymodactylos carnosus]CAF1395188.1 unnamed protein product [Didymodactylos carnosus]CAF3809820.1 unnamed protein product [Didymodactylos carnosus]CAF4202527.1 unnamed protein product [Didymodactylos carnosus]